MPVSKRLRFEVLKRDGYRCRYCSATEKPLTVDHVVPTALGGRSEPTNLVAACRDCNAGKASSSPDAPILEDVAHDALRWRRAMEQAAEFQRGQRKSRHDYLKGFEETWYDWTVCDSPVQLPDDWANTVGQFHDLGLEPEFVTDAIERAMRAGIGKRFNYFCGVCWRTLQDRQKTAGDLLASE